VLYPFVGNSVGGSHLSTLALIDGLMPYGVKPVILLHERGVLADYLNQRGIQYVIEKKIVPVRSRFLLLEVASMLLCSLRVARLLRLKAIDLVHTNDTKMHRTWAFGAILAGCKTIWHQRSADNSRRLAFFSFFSTAIVTISEHCRSSLPQKMSSRAIVIYDYMLPVETKYHKADMKRRLLDEMKLSPDRLVVGFVANLNVQKKPQNFLKIAKRLETISDLPFAFPMIGGGSRKQAIQLNNQINQKELGKVCQLLGSKHPISDWMIGFDLLIVPATNEGLGRTLIEAASLHVPVLASDDGGHREIILDGENGRLICPSNIVEFAEAALEILTNKQFAQKLVDKAHNDIVRKFSSENNLSKILALYKKLIG
jgi:glycosyltransferase involved in cell wall biosynthesis